jgi:hypothetical protein
MSMENAASDKSKPHKKKKNKAKNKFKTQVRCHPTAQCMWRASPSMGKMIGPTVLQDVDEEPQIASGSSGKAEKMLMMESSSSATLATHQAESSQKNAPNSSQHNRHHKEEASHRKPVENETEGSPAPSCRVPQRRSQDIHVA